MAVPEIQPEAENAEELKLGPVFDRDEAQALTNSEALTLLTALQKTRKEIDTNYIPAPMVEQTRRYLERFSTVKSQQGQEAVREHLVESDIKPFELCSIVNLGPGSAEEAKALVPSLENIGDRFPDDETLQQVLDNAEAFKNI